MPLQDFRKNSVRNNIEQNTARMNIKQQEKKAEEIRSGYAQINRDQAEIKRQVMEIRQDHDRIARELENSKQDEKELESLLRQSSQNWMNGKKKRRKSPGSRRNPIFSHPLIEQKEKFDQENLSRLKAEITAL